ncbi:hypothetical protein EN836_32480 [Mesorhizobium sp. M1C.F.Ca.ET.193.01.1.1]|uniref:hypothetical protein n=1 Tax=unclassified Mesorhizobium TaxID=325217 RepID=UPI000FD526D8|nr:MULTISPECIES: hypothetical protein [unclassified Mesorhizobium]TGS91225.1 hypothetical protein EN820_53050 [bacterium M00.F.Ca.ET.177.01.1.1]TGQ49711.1 hypothetical protein EN853_32475 [Mesorhizobium sp. M1C.F.Ca.ET.210.01.1.1]TGQ63946.1 hypothetical protein EN855_032490 [Mesorhizobium sp. M1C.F.Ca.ET.212.01.1.1]TGQ97835.1 hypothetical protein EN847_32360 [Mesorhizobium sp. M1C.F.Ca.ET.204.01.1.1]TGR17839.1 hypothetical protein EN839_32475 [Mesorhizobium sp. M1C.F.Ca.ET.196.01.1.1]
MFRASFLIAMTIGGASISLGDDQAPNYGTFVTKMQVFAGMVMSEHTLSPADLAHMDELEQKAKSTLNPSEFDQVHRIAVSIKSFAARLKAGTASVAPPTSSQGGKGLLLLDLIYATADYCYHHNDVSFSETDVENIRKAMKAISDKSDLDQAAKDQNWKYGQYALNLALTQPTSEVCASARTQAALLLPQAINPDKNPF